MYLKSILVYFLLISNLSLLRGQNSFFEIDGEALNSKQGDKIFISYKINNIIVVDSSEIRSGCFFLKGKIDFPVKAFISNSSEFDLDGVNSSIIYLEPKKAVLSVDYKNFKSLSLNKYKTHDEYLSLLLNKSLLDIKRDSIYSLLQYSKNELKVNKNNSKTTFQLEANISKLDKLMAEIHSEDRKFDFDFISKNRSSFVSPHLLLFWIKRKESSILYSKIDSLYNSLSVEIKKGYAGIELKRTIENLRNSKLGERAPNFDLKDISRNQITLNSFKGEKIILLDFWATWCAPCREDFAYLKEVFKRYNVKGFEIISLSKDDNLELWRQTVKKDRIENWKHISIKENYKNTSNHSTLEEDYFVNSIPVKVLINKDGIIIGRWRGGGNENKEELDKMLQRIFE